MIVEERDSDFYVECVACGEYCSLPYNELSAIFGEIVITAGMILDVAQCDCIFEGPASVEYSCTPNVFS